MPLEALDILVVDDDVACLDSLGDFLEHEGHRIRTATRGSEAVAIARRRRCELRPFQLSILDVHVPDMSGLETFAQLADCLPGIGAIFVSGRLTRALAESIRTLGGFASIEKPFDLTTIRREIAAFRRHLEAREP